MWDPQVFALALAKAVETKDATDADFMLRALVGSICHRRGLSRDAGDILQSTWAIILEKARAHQTSPSIAKQIPKIIENLSSDIFRKRRRTAEIVQKLDRYLHAVGADNAEAIASEEAKMEETFAAIMGRLRDDNERQHAAVTLTLESENQEEARKKYEQLYNESITPDYFRQLHSRGKKRLRRYREQSND